jgi:hypothetical protein
MSGSFCRLWNAGQILLPDHSALSKTIAFKLLMNQQLATVVGPHGAGMPIAFNVTSFSATHPAEGRSNIMHENLSNLSFAEHDLGLFLNALEVELPADNPEHPDDFVVIPLNPLIASYFDSQDGKVVLLCYRCDGNVYPISLFSSAETAEVFFVIQRFCSIPMPVTKALRPDFEKSLKSSFLKMRMSYCAR